MAAVRRDRYAERAVTLRIAVIADGGMVQRFALNALDAIEGPTEITVFSCTNTHVRKHWVKHGAYYALNLLAIRNRLTRLVPVRSGTKSVSREIEFESSYDGAWQVLPTHVIEALRSFDLVLKFGMGLLRVPPPDLLPVPILSYHHGDPDNFRGRPAGFWEVFQGASVVGQVMQVIGDRLDAGNVAAFAETKLFPWSYRRTLLDAYRVSPLIINAAIRNALSTTYLEKSRDGRNYRLPSNLMVVRFVIRMLAQVVKRIFYGALQEKAWRVSTSARPEGLLATAFPDPDTWMTIPVASGYSFYADPFFSNDPQAILVEGFRSGVGEIVRIDQSGHRSLIREPGHVSYPAVANIAGKEFIVPETASWSGPRVYSGNELQASLRIDCDPRVSDPTLIEWDGTIYLFGNDRRLGSNVLSLWAASALEDRFRLHPASPIRISPQGSRMGGNIILHDGRLVRLGQDLSGDYGNGLIIFEISELNESRYSEREVGRIQFADRKGPHTLNVRDDSIVFDWYRDRFHVLAGFRRLKAVLQKRRLARSVRQLSVKPV